MANPLQDPVFVLHRYFIWSNEMMGAFKMLVLEQSRGTASAWGSDEFIRIHMYMSLWYAALWTVVEGWQELKLRDPSIDALLASETGRMRKKDGSKAEVPETYADLLRRVRNTVFHFQRDYFDERVIDFMKQEKSVTWVQGLQSAFDRWFLNWLRTREQTPK